MALKERCHGSSFSDVAGLEFNLCLATVLYEGGVTLKIFHSLSLSSLEAPVQGQGLFGYSGSARQTSLSIQEKSLFSVCIGILP